MPKPFANAPHATFALMNGEWLLGIQTGNNSGDSGLSQMKYIKLSELTQWVRSSFGQMWNYRGEFSASLPSDPQVNDYFLATGSFSVGGKTYEANHLYAYNGSSWDDISGVLTQYASQSQVTDIDNRLTVVEVKVDAMGDGIVYKGAVATYADLAGIVDPQRGWEYYVTGEAAFYVYNGASWDPIDNGIVQTVTSGDISHAPSSDAVYNEFSVIKNSIQATNARVENLEQEHGSYQEVTVKSPYTIPSGKAKNWSVNVLRGVTRGHNQLMNEHYKHVSWTIDNSAGSSPLYGTKSVYLENSYRLDASHKYLLFFVGTKTITGNAGLYCNVANNQAKLFDFGTQDAKIQTFTIQNPSARVSFPTIVNPGASVVLNGTFGLVDLNQYFSSDPSVDVSTLTISDIQTNYPELLLPSDYDAGSLVSTTYEGVRSRFVNWWNGQYETGSIDNTTGQDTAGSTLYRSVGYTEVRGGQSYYWLSTYNSSHGGGAVYLYDSSKNFIKMIDDCRNMKIDTTPETAYIRFKILVSYFANEQIALDSCPVKTTYHAWVNPSTLSLPTPITLRSAGTVAEEFDLETGEKTNPLGSVDLGTLSWTPSGSVSGAYYATLTGYSYKQDCGGIMGKYNYIGTVSTGTSALSDYDKVVALYYNLNVPATREIYLRDTSLSDASQISGYFQYELATPDAPTQLDPIQNPYLATESGGTISSILTDAVDDSMTLGYINL